MAGRCEYRVHCTEIEPLADKSLQQPRDWVWKCLIVRSVGSVSCLSRTDPLCSGFGDTAVNGITQALDAGFVHIDTAQVHWNSFRSAQADTPVELPQPS